jgi:hypothetical protein
MLVLGQEVSPQQAPAFDYWCPPFMDYCEALTPRKRETFMALQRVMNELHHYGNYRVKGIFNTEPEVVDGKLNELWAELAELIFELVPGGPAPYDWHSWKKRTGFIEPSDLAENAELLLAMFEDALAEQKRQGEIPPPPWLKTPHAFLPTTTPTATRKKRRNVWPWLVGGAAAVLVVGAVVYKKSKKRKRRR